LARELLVMANSKTLSARGLVKIVHSGDPSNSGFQNYVFAIILYTNITPKEI